MRKINEIIVHCSATPEGQPVTVSTIREWHLQRGWKDIGYHYVIYLDGTVHDGRPIDKVGAHVAGHNTGTIGICYVGGVEKDGKTPKDTRTEAQKKALVKLLVDLTKRYNVKKISGHNQYAAKACPSFNAGKEYGWIVGATTTPVVKEADTRVRYLQRLLVKRGYELGLTDGIIGPKTIKAINRFQKDYGLNVTGKFDSQTVATLKEGIPQEITPEVEEVLAHNDKSAIGSTTNIATTIGTVSGVSATANEAIDAAKNVQTTAEGLIAAGPWILVTVLILGIGGYIIYERIKKARLARKAKASLEA